MPFVFVIKWQSKSEFYEAALRLAVLSKRQQHGM
jgi:hypothetical protein